MPLGAPHLAMKKQSFAQDLYNLCGENLSFNMCAYLTFNRIS
jgi:hypothetical protein